MKRETAFQLLSDIDDDFIAEAVNYAPDDTAKSLYMKKKRLLSFALAAALILALGAAAYAMGLFSFTHRSKAPRETYSIHWDNPEGRIDFDDFNYVFKFSGPDECRGVQFKEGWLPFAPNENVNSWCKTEDGWRTRLVSECAPEVDSTSLNYQPYRVELFYVPQYKDDGALVLNFQVPEEITEEQWGEHQVLKFHAVQHLNAVDDDELDIHIPARDNHYYFVILFHPEKGYIAVVSGTSDMETVEHVAKELSFRQTDEVIRKDDSKDNFTFIDVSQG